MGFNMSKKIMATHLLFQRMLSSRALTHTRITLACFCICSLLSACEVGPNYSRPPAPVPTKFKEAHKHWKVAQPDDAFNRGSWWLIFHDQQLNSLEEQLNHANQSIAQVQAQYEQSVALVAEARAGFYPTLSVSAGATRQKQQKGFFNSTTTSTTSTSGGSSSGSPEPITTNSVSANASWMPDIWGSVRRTVEASAAGAEASAAQIALTRLMSQASLAQFYFQLRGLDRDQKLLDDTVVSYRKILQLTQNEYRSGVASRADIVSAQSVLETAQAQAINNGILRGQYEHAIAVLIGVPPGDFAIAANTKRIKPPTIPIEVPSALLEHRPDIAQAERSMEQANAQIGVAIATYFPALTLTGAASQSHQGLAHWIEMPDWGWSLGAELAEQVLDGGLRSATVRAAKANYRATVASYRQIVLAAFQNVEDNLVAVRILKDQEVVEKKAAASANLALQLTINQYKAGTVPFSSVVTAEINAFAAEKIASDVVYQQMTSAVNLVEALGGGWDKKDIPKI